jgi:hypothetical protein
MIISHNTRSLSGDNFYVNYSRLNQQKQYFSRIGVGIWNSIPVESKKQRKTNLKFMLHNILLKVLECEDDCVDTPNLIKIISSYC